LPLYEYLCAKCGHRFEKIEKLSAPHRQKCPKCGGKAERQLAPPAIMFKGSGWYVTDYAGKSGGAKDTTAKDAGATDSKETKETKEVTEAKEVKDKKDKKPRK